MKNGSSPYRDAMRVLEEIRDYCARRQRCYEGWNSTSESSKMDLRHIKNKAEDAIKHNTPRFETANEL